MLAGSPVMNIYQSFKKSFFRLSEPRGSGVGGKESSHLETGVKDHGSK